MTKTPNPVDQHVGSRVRMRRMLVGVSQEKLADALGVTFQQVQKYEKGTNRISASRLQQMADVLGVEVAWFFVREDGGSSSSPPAAGTELLARFIALPEGVRMMRAMVGIESAELRRRLVALAETVSEEVGAEPRRTPQPA